MWFLQSKDNFMFEKRETMQKELIQSVEIFLVDNKLSFTKEMEEGDCYFDVAHKKIGERTSIDIRHDLTEFFVRYIEEAHNEVIININNNYLDDVLNFLRIEFLEKD